MREQAQLTCRSTGTITLHSVSSTQITPDCTGERLVTIATYACVRCGSIQAYRVMPANMTTIGA